MRVMSNGVIYQNPIISEMEIKSANNKRIFLNGTVEEDMAIKVGYFVNKIIEMDKLAPNPKKEITFILNNFGGSVIHGNSIISNIKRLKSEGYKTIGVVESCAYSMGFDILVHFDERIGSHLSTYLLHQTGFGVGGELKEIMREAEFQKVLWELSVDYYVVNTKIPRERIEKVFNSKENWFFTAQEALELGVIHKILN